METGSTQRFSKTKLSFKQMGVFWDAIFGDSSASGLCYCGKPRLEHAHVIRRARMDNKRNITNMIMGMGYIDSNGLFTPCVVAPGCAEYILR